MDLNKVSGHPGFLAYRGTNVGVESNTTTEANKVEDSKEKIKDQELAGGEQGKAE